MNENGKRLRSDGDDGGVQMKYFVNQQLVDRHSEDLMKKVYAKTLRLIFDGAQIHSKNVQDKAMNKAPNEDALKSITRVSLKFIYS